MGADLYIKNMPRDAQYTGFEVSKRAVEVGYFRDCYNPTGLFNFVGSNTRYKPSWWQFHREQKWFDKFGDMTVAGARKFLALARCWKVELSKRHEFWLDSWDQEGKNVGKQYAVTGGQIIEYFNWLDLLIAFLELAIKCKSKIEWSV
jgi:hypothetical protein